MDDRAFSVAYFFSFQPTKLKSIFIEIVVMKMKGKKIHLSSLIFWKMRALNEIIFSVQVIERMFSIIQHAYLKVRILKILMNIIQNIVSLN